VSVGGPSFVRECRAIEEAVRGAHDMVSDNRGGCDAVHRYGVELTGIEAVDERHPGAVRHRQLVRLQLRARA
jgi:hypothetical protein